MLQQILFDLFYLLKVFQLPLWLSKFCLIASSKMSLKLLENIIQKIHLVDKISKGQYIDLDAKLEIKKILHISFLKLRHG